MRIWRPAAQDLPGSCTVCKTACIYPERPMLTVWKSVMSVISKKLAFQDRVGGPDQ